MCPVNSQPLGASRGTGGGPFLSWLVRWVLFFTQRVLHLRFFVLMKDKLCERHGTRASEADHVFRTKLGDNLHVLRTLAAGGSGMGLQGLCMHKLSLPLLLATLLSACAVNPMAKNAAELANATLEEDGSPYRWAVGHQERDGTTLLLKQLIGQPCDTAADPTLAADTLVNIGKAEAQSGGVSAPSLVETRCVAIDALGVIQEVWVVSRGEKQVPYVVNFLPDPAGGAKIEIHGPW